MENKQIKELIEYYCRMKIKPGYAILLSGEWGSGKTHFIDECKEALADQIKFLHISLYGITSISEIETKFFQELNPRLSSKGMVLGATIAKGLLRGTLKIDLDGDSNADGSLRTEIPNIELSKYFTPTDGYVLIFDDVERCAIPLNVLFGYINHLVEKDGYKAILIADERALSRKASEDTKQEYRPIKEKLVGTTVKLTPDTESAIQAFLSESKESELKDKCDLIKTVFSLSTYKNLRVLRKLIISFNRISSILSKDIRDKDKLLDSIIAHYFIVGLEVNANSVRDEQELEDLLGSKISAAILGDKTSDQKKRMAETLSKYKDLTVSECPISSDIWSSLFFHGTIDKDELNQSIKSSAYFYSENTPSWQKLWRLHDISDDEFQILYKDVKTKFDNKEYRDIPTIKHVVGMFIGQSQRKLIDWPTSSILASAKKYIDEIMSDEIVETIQSHKRFFDDTGSFGLGYSESDSDEFKEFSKYIENTSLAFIDNALPDKAIELLDLLNSDPSKFLGDLYYSEGEEGKYARLALLHKIPQQEFIDTLVKLSPKDKQTVAYTLSLRYESAYNNKTLTDEIDWLKGIIDALTLKIEDNKGKLMGMHLSYVKNYAQKGLTALEEIS